MKTPLALLCASFTAITAYAAKAPTPAEPTASITLRDFKLVGDLNKERAAFTLSAIAKVENAKGGSLDLLSGPVALTELGAHPRWEMRAEPNRYTLVFDRRGEFPVQLKFNAAVHSADGWNTVEFHVAPGPLQQVVLQGLAADTQFQFIGAARPERTTNSFVSYLPSDGNVKLSWKEKRAEAEGKLFYAAEMLSQISVSPGLMRQVGLLDFKIMQGEMNRVVLLLHGEGEVTRVSGDNVLAWTVEPERGASAPPEGETNSVRAERMLGAPTRRLVVQLNSPQKDHFALQVQMQTPLGAFPQTSDAMQLQPEGATRFAGYVRIVNEGAVRLEVAQASGMSQISPEQFPESDATRAALRVTGSQRFAYRFSGADFALKIQADQILPELAVSELLNYNLGQNELAIDAEIELDIREAPLRELLLRVPKNYVIAKLNVPGSSDYFLTDSERGSMTRSNSETISDSQRLTEPRSEAQSELRIVYGQPVSGRQLIQLRLEHNQPLGETNWLLPRLEVNKAKSVRGFVGVSADAGFRLTPERTQSLTEIATAFFPRKVAGVQSAFRLSDPAWQATMHVERLPQTVQADVLHLFSIGEGIAYGSSVMNYTVSGAPMSAFKVELSDEYFNVEFTGKDIRNWQKVDGGYLVQLHTPVSGAYTLLATYERPFKPQGETLAFTGARPLDAQTEQGHTIIISAYQFSVKPATVSAGLLPLETGEVPPEYRLLFDAPILAAYRYSARPFSLQLALSPLAQGDSLNQVVDRASLDTRISKEGQVLTDVRYFVKSRGNPHFRVTLPPGTQLWSATVNGAAVVPVIDKDANLIPLPQRGDPDAILEVYLKLAQTNDARRVTIAAPVLAAPVMLAEWKLQPDAGQRLIYRHGSLTPVGGVLDVSGFAGLAKLFSGEEADKAWTLVFAALLLVGAAMVVWRWTVRNAQHRFSPRHLAGLIVGVFALMLAMKFVLEFSGLAGAQNTSVPSDVKFLAPVQQAKSALNVEVLNVPNGVSIFNIVSYAWPVLLALVAWVYSLQRDGTAKSIARIFGWLFLAWAALRIPNGAAIFVWLVVVFVGWQLILPVLRALWRLPVKPQTDLPAKPGAASATTALLIGGLFLSALSARSTEPLPAKQFARAETVTQEIRIDDKFAFGSAKIHWRAEKGETLPLLQTPAVLTHLNSPRGLKLTQSADRSWQELVAESSGTFDVEVRYQISITKWNADGGLLLPVRGGLVHRLNFTVVNSDVDVLSPQAVSTQRELAGSNTVAQVVLSPEDNVHVFWKPRSRDVKREKPIFYAEISQLYAPSAGVIEGAHYVSIRPAQGELSELVLDVPKGMTITDVLDGSSRREEALIKSEIRSPKSEIESLVTSAATGKLVSLWRFDPETRKLRVTLNPAQSRPFVVLVRSQIATGPLPFEQSVGLISLDGAAGQIGLLGIATGNEVQLDSVNAERFAPINLEDFPSDAISALPSQIAGLTLRRAFRYADTTAVTSVKASPVEPDVRVETQDTLSLGEDRTVLAANATVNITRAGIFRLSFVMPAGFDVESISGSALSHWTESKQAGERIITLHFPGKTEGQQQFAISLASPGVKATNGWAVPQIVLREAGKQLGTLLVVPEQGMSLQAVTREGVTELDPQRAGIRQKGVLAFRILQTPLNLTLDIAQVEAWIQVTSLQHANVSEAQVKVAANLQYQIDNTGLKALRVRLPVNAEGVNFQGEQIGGFAVVSGAVTNEMKEWEVKLQRRVIGQYLLQVSYQVPTPGQERETTLRGVEAADVNLQRGFVTVQSDPRLQLSVDAAPAALQAAEWQSIPRALQPGLPAASANFAYRLVDPSFALPLKLERHEAARLLPARVNNITFNSVISDDGVMLMQTKLEILPGDKRLLNLTLPGGAKFWFAFVNDNGVWPWRAADKILIPLEQQSRADKPVSVEIFYSCVAGAKNSRSLDLELLAPKFDLPLENITWRVSLSDKWRVKNWNGSLQLQEQEYGPQTSAIDLQSYLQNETAQRQERTKEAEEFLVTGNSALAQGDPQQARRAFQAAFGLSTYDAAFNEDARVRLHNIKLQQALVGLNVRQANANNEGSMLPGKLRELSNRKELNYTQQEAKDIMDRNNAEENAAYMRLAERLIQQQDAAVSRASALCVSIPEQGRVLTFQRAVVVDREADLRIGLEAVAARAASWGTRIGILVGIFVLFAVVFWLRKSVVVRSESLT